MQKKVEKPFLHLIYYFSKLAINNDYSETPTVAAANDYVRIGEEGGYFLGKEKKGAIQQYYDCFLIRTL